MYRGSTIEGPRERVEPRRLWESGLKATSHEDRRCRRSKPPWRHGHALAFSLNHYVMIT
jgi:hypothetical protein